MASSSCKNIKRKNIGMNRSKERKIAVNMIQQTNVEIIANDTLESILERMNLFSEKQKSRTWSVQAESTRRKIGEHLMCTFENFESEQRDKVCLCRERETKKLSKSSEQNRDHALQGIVMSDKSNLGLSEKGCSVRKWETGRYQQRNPGSSKFEDERSYKPKSMGSYNLRNPVFLKGFDSHDRSFRGMKGHGATGRKNDVTVKEHRAATKKNRFNQTIKVQRPQNIATAHHKMRDGKKMCNELRSAGDHSCLQSGLGSARVGSEERFGCLDGERLEAGGETESDGQRSFLHSRLANARVRDEKQLDEEPQTSKSRRGSPVAKFCISGNTKRNVTFDLPGNIMSIQSRNLMASRNPSMISFDNEPMSWEKLKKEASPLPNKYSRDSSNQDIINSRSIRLVKQKAIDISDDASLDSYFESCAHSRENSDDVFEFGARKQLRSLPQVIPRRPISCLPAVESSSLSFMSINSFSSVDNFVMSSSSEDRRSGALFGETITSDGGACDVMSNESVELPCFVLSEYRSYVSVDETNNGDALETARATAKGEQHTKTDGDLINEDGKETVRPNFENDETTSTRDEFNATIEEVRCTREDDDIKKQTMENTGNSDKPSTSSTELRNEREASGGGTHPRPVINLTKRTESNENLDSETAGTQSHPPKRLSLPGLRKLAGTAVAEMPARSCLRLPALGMLDNDGSVQRGLAAANNSFLQIPIDLSVGGLTEHSSNSNKVSFEYAFKKRMKFKIRSQEIDFES